MTNTTVLIQEGVEVPYRIRPSELTSVDYQMNVLLTQEGEYIDLCKYLDIKFISDMNGVTPFKYVDTARARRSIEKYFTLEVPAIFYVSKDFDYELLEELEYTYNVNEGAWISKDRATAVTEERDPYKRRVTQYSMGKGQEYLENVTSLKHRGWLTDELKFKTLL